MPDIRTKADIMQDIQVMRAVLTFNQMVKQDKMAYISYCGIRSAIPEMCQAITSNPTFKQHYASVRLDRLLAVWPRVYNLKDSDLDALIKTLEADLNCLDRTGTLKNAGETKA